MTCNEFGVWSIELPHQNRVCIIPHGSKVKISMVLPDGSRIERLPAWIHRAEQELDKNPVYEAIFWNPPEKYVFKHPRPPKPNSLRIYEAHGNSF
jgi:1,4-alpha-glucan branching enzyme